MNEAIAPIPDAASAADHLANGKNVAPAEASQGASQSSAEAPSTEGDASGASALSEATLQQLERICERLGADRQRSPQMARQLVKRAGQLARERDWSEAQALEHLLGLLLNASTGGDGSQSPH